jgi:hypothetical protein
MDFTFGIITNGENDHCIKIIIESIYNNKIPNFEIIIVGNTKIDVGDNIIVYEFNENIKQNWITRKKNIICENAKYENIVLLHDYIKLEDDWYKGFLKFGNDFDWCVNKIINHDGRRFRDYTLYTGRIDGVKCKYQNVRNIDEHLECNRLLPYDFENNIKTNKYMYISGSYYVIKKRITDQFKLNEELSWGQGEDFYFSRMLDANGIIIKCNKFSSVKLLKYKQQTHWETEIDKKTLQKFIEICNSL